MSIGLPKSWLMPVALLLAGCGGGSGSGGSGVDQTPDAFAFVDQFDVDFASNVPLATSVTSSSETLAGLCPAGAAISISGDPSSRYSINGGTFTASPGTVVNGDTVRVRLTSSSSFDTEVEAILTVQGEAATF